MQEGVATRNPAAARTPRTAGVGLRLPHLAEVAASARPVAWLEIHPENFLANPHARELLQDVAGRYPIPLHTVGVSIGSADGIDPLHLARVRELVDAIDPILVSGHLAWSTHAGVCVDRASGMGVDPPVSANPRARKVIGGLPR